VSRPKYSLLIVDSSMGYQHFWGPIKNNYDDLFEYYLHNYSNAEQWDKDYISIFEHVQNIEWDEYKDEPLLLARSFEMQGVQTKNVEDLILAEQNYNRAKKYGEEKKVKAFRLNLIKEYKEAGEIYQSLGKYDDALKSFWQGENYSHITELSKIHSRLIYAPETNAAEYMLYRNDPQRADKFLSQIHEQFQNTTTRQSLIYDISSSKTWQSVLETLIASLADYCASENNEVLSKKIHHQIVNSFGKLINVISSNMALIKYYADIKSEAIDIWETTKSGKYPNEYYKAKAEISIFPENILWYNRLNDYDSIYHIYHKHKDNVNTLDDDTMNILLNTIVNMKQYDDLIFLFKHLDMSKYKQLNIDYELLLELLYKNKEYDILINVFAKNATESIINNLIRANKKAHPELVILLYLAMMQKYIKINSVKDVIKLVNTVSGSFKEKEECTYMLKMMALEYLCNLETENIKLDKKILEDISIYLKNTYVNHNAPWNSVYDYYSTLIVFEKLGRIIDALEFYESIFKNSLNDEILIGLSRERWVKIKNKQGELYSN